MGADGSELRGLAALVRRRTAAPVAAAVHDPRMTPEFYRLLHIVGVLMLFLGLGGMFASEAGKAPKLFAALHGIGLLLMVVAGVGYVHKKPLAWDSWLFAKIACWVLMGALPVLVKRGVVPRVGAIVLALAIGATAAWLAQAKPF
jgi:hypothetical protein